MKKLTTFVLVAALAMLVLTGIVYAASPAPTTNMIVGRPAKGMYCADPAKWIQGGYKIYVWGNATPVKAQAYDISGYLLNPATGITWKVTNTGETGTMSVVDSTNKVYAATPKSMSAVAVGDFNYEIQYTADGKTFNGVVRRWNSGCDGCHASPPGHAIENAGSNGVSTCRNCHNLADKQMSSHATRVPNNATAQACYSCHPTGCYSGLHTPYGIDCVSCHGSLDKAPSGQMKISSQLGLPKCEDCHVTPPDNTVAYAQNPGKEYKESVGHGRANKGAKSLCIVCHNSMHMEQDPEGLWGDGANNNCAKCHVDKPNDKNMGPNCGQCHVSSVDPHKVKKRG